MSRIRMSPYVLSLAAAVAGVILASVAGASTVPDTDRDEWDFNDVGDFSSGFRVRAKPACLCCTSINQVPILSPCAWLLHVPYQAQNQGLLEPPKGPS